MNGGVAALKSMARRPGAAVYDCLFVQPAVRVARPLATFDNALLKAFPGIAVRPDVLVPA